MVYLSYHCRSRYRYYPHIIIITIIQMHLHAQHQTFRAEFLNLSSSVDCVMDLLQEISLTATLWVTNCSGICGFWYQQIRSTLVDPRRPEMAICRHIVVTLHQPTRIRSTAEQLVQHTHPFNGPRSRQITMPAPHRSVFYRPDALPAAQPTVSKHWTTARIQ